MRRTKFADEKFDRGAEEGTVPKTRIDEDYMYRSKRRNINLGEARRALRRVRRVAAVDIEQEARAEGLLSKRAKKLLIVSKIKLI